MTTPSERENASASERAPTSFLQYEPPKAAIPQGLPLADPKAHKPLYKMIKSLLKPRVKHPKVRQPKWKKKHSFH